MSDTTSATRATVRSATVRSATVRSAALSAPVISDAALVSALTEAQAILEQERAALRVVQDRTLAAHDTVELLTQERTRRRLLGVTNEQISSDPAVLQWLSHASWNNGRGDALTDARITSWLQSHSRAFVRHDHSGTDGSLIVPVLAVSSSEDIGALTSAVLAVASALPSDPAPFALLERTCGEYGHYQFRVSPADRHAELTITSYGHARPVAAGPLSEVLEVIARDHPFD